MRNIGVYIAGQPSPFACRLALRLRDEPDVDIVGAGDGSTQVVEAVMRLRPQVVLLETDLSDQPGVDAVKGLKNACPDVSVITIGPPMTPESPDSGASPPPPEAIGGDDVITALLQVLSGASAFPPDMLEDLEEDRVIRRIARWSSLAASNGESPSSIREKRYNVLISGRRACPDCYESSVRKREKSNPSSPYECSGCGVSFVGATLVGTRIGIAERASFRN